MSELSTNGHQPLSPEESAHIVEQLQAIAEQVRTMSEMLRELADHLRQVPVQDHAATGVQEGKI